MSCVSGPGLLQRLPCLGTIRSGQQNRPNAARLFVDRRVLLATTAPMMDVEGRYKAKQAMNLQRWADAESGTTAHTAADEHLPPPASHNAQMPKFVREYADYYKTPRGYHPRSVNSNTGWSRTTPLAFINMPMLQRAGELKAPALIVHGEKAHSRYFSEDAFKSLGSQNKELFLVKDASHVDLYDKQSGKIPFDKFEQFFRTNLK